MRQITRLRLAFLLPFLALAAPAAGTEPLPAASGYGLDGMAPDGRWATRLTLLRNGYTTRFDNAKERVDLDAGMNGLDLATLGLAGTLRLDTRVVTEYSELMFGYGVTGDLTVGAIVPYARTTTYVRFGVDGGIGTAGLQSVLTGPLGYRPLQTTRSEGIGDPTVGMLWRIQKSGRDSTLLGLGVRFGMAKADDPNNLVDIPPGDGSTDLRARLEYFRDLGAGFDLRLLGEYFWQLEDNVRLRPGNPLTTTTSENLRRKLGNYYEHDIELGKRFGDWRVAGTWHRYREAVDRYTSSIGTDTSYLSANTETLADQLRLSISWSGVDAFLSGRFAAPLIVKLEVQDAVRGRNFVGVRDVYLRLSTFF
jgi:hypothetical protein